MYSSVGAVFCTLLASSSAFQSFELRASTNTSDPSTACSVLKQSYPNITFLPEDDRYTTENEASWTSAAWLGPACIFAPACANQLSFAVKTLVNTSTLFAMRGGGHMPISDAANINSSGVLISSTNLNTLQLSDDKQTMSIGPGPRWGDVFNYLEGTNLTIVGGRLGPVGVPGLLLGGGISWYSYKYGMASAGGKIKAYEAVLADGTIATITANSSYSDLHWALQGGGNSFALITRFDLQTFPSGPTLMAEASYGSSNTTRDAWLSAILNFALTSHEDTSAAIIPVARWGPNSTAPSYETTLFYANSVAPSTGVFAEMVNGNTTTGLKALNGSSTLQPLTLAQYGAAVRPAFKPGGESYGLRQKFRVISTKATMEALRIVHDTYIAGLKSSGIANRLPGFFSGLAFNAVTKTFAEKSAGMPQNVPPEPAFWIEQSLTWEAAEDDKEVEEWLSRVDEEIYEKLEEVGGAGRYVYLNDADKGQAVFEGYGEENVRKLKEIRGKYDPGRVFTELMPGGFKVEGS
ncbi:FAD-binding domain-containing protein [Lindgomyces ingoldianus]|uniref:FAD-binding domain-containing protein n=1 Tax=Lindgomyces ingoldianus TaxID=673940 RepID=A0ACB6QEK7_9PLEO|nr:FAD-binding domain-containing protein [Lindgomyces ingoldianus]KAF2464585.1 FAD-binding domain-containing protein [Lindgomyces ingoldianus]